MNGIYNETNADHRGNVFKVLAMAGLYDLWKVLIISCGIFRYFELPLLWGICIIHLFSGTRFWEIDFKLATIVVLVLPKNLTHTISRFLYEYVSFKILVFVVFCKESRIWLNKKLIPTKQLSIFFTMSFVLE